MQLLHVEGGSFDGPPGYSLFDTARPLEVVQPTSTFQGKKKAIPWEFKRTKFHDYIFVFVFIAVMVTYTLLAIDSIQYVYILHQQRLDSIWQNFVLNNKELNLINFMVMGICVIAAALFIGFLQLVGILLFYKAFVIGAFVLNLMVSTLLCIYFVQNEMFRAFFATLAFTLIVIIFAFKLRKKFLFSTIIIKIGSQLMKSTPSIWIVYMFMLTLNSLVLCFYFIVLYTSYITWKNETDPNAKYYVTLFLVFSGYYFTEIFQNSTQVVIGAIVAKWYYGSDVKTTNAIKNTFVKCFGSICLGSLFSSIFSILKEIIILIKPSDKILQYPLLKPLWKLIQIIVFCLNYTLKYFNNYSFAYISIHSTNYLKSSLKMYKLYCNKGYSTLVSECIIYLVLRLYIVFSGITGAAIAYACIRLIQPEFIIQNSSWWLLVAASALLAMQISRMIAMIINAYVYVLFVCLIQHRDIMMCTHPEEYKTIYPFLSPIPPMKSYK